MRTMEIFARQCLSVSLLGTMSIAVLPLALSTPSLPNPPETSARGTAPTRRLNPSGLDTSNTTDLFSRLTARHHWQQSHLDRFSVVRTYKMENDKNKLVAEEVVDMKYKAPTTETFTSTSGKGSGFIRNHVFLRIMKDEEHRVRANKNPDSLITPKNYTLRVIGEAKIGGSDCWVISALPKRREIDLFEGTIWVDNQDYAIVKIAGHLAKSPSFWIKRVDFVRDYQKIDGFWLLSREEAASIVRLVGKETLTVDYRDYNVNGGGTVQPAVTNMTRGRTLTAQRRASHNKFAPKASPQRSQ